MKKLISVLLAAVIFFSIANIAFAEGLLTATAAPQYKLTDVQYNGKDVTGKVVLESGAAYEGKIKVRVTFYIIGNYYMATSYTVGSDGSFKITGVGPIVYITVFANAVDSDGNATRMDATELFVTQE